MDTPEVVLLAIVHDIDASFPEPRAHQLREEWRGSLDEAQAVFAEEPEVMVALGALEALWPRRAPTETELWHRIDLGAGGEMIVAFELPVR